MLVTNATELKATGELKLIFRPHPNLDEVLTWMPNRLTCYSKIG
jgi:hypothetical protein